MGYSRIQLWQYITGILLIFLLAWHFASRIPPLRGVDTFLDTLKPDKVYEDLGGASGVLALLLAYAALFHGLNGLRGILFEWFGESRRGIINALMILLFIIFAGLATYAVAGITSPG
ncbi:MAG: hypothetical protein GSR86_01245 [Desulfurococcales archaeon]|nr:hypothetical protein [Desulfurococcales archaeon]